MSRPQRRLRSANRQRLRWRSGVRIPSGARNGTQVSILSPISAKGSGLGEATGVQVVIVGSCTHDAGFESRTSAIGAP